MQLLKSEQKQNAKVEMKRTLKFGREFAQTSLVIFSVYFLQQALFSFKFWNLE